MGIYIEALILYIVLFLSGSAGAISGTATPKEFSVTAEIIRFFLHSVPSLALIWYLIVKSWKIDDWIVRPGRKDLLAFVITLPFLLITGFTTSFISSFTGGTAAQIMLSSPSTASGWIILCISCISTAYLEESYFRFYLLSRRAELNMNSTLALAFSTALFSICHIYEGPWGFLNAVISGAFLCFIFLRYSSFHGIAIAHGFYNILAYVINALSGRFL